MKAKEKYLRELVEYFNSAVRLGIPHRSIVAFESFASVVKNYVKAAGHKEEGQCKSVQQLSKRLKCLSEDVSSEKIFYAGMDGHAGVFSNSMKKLGVQCSCIGAMEVPADSVFEHLVTDWNKISALLPPVNPELEFGSNNIVMCNEDISEYYNQPCGKKSISFTALPQSAWEMELVAFIDWDELPHPSELAYSFFHKVIRPLGKRDFQFLFNLSEATKKSVFEIDEILDIISCFSTYGKVTFSLNEDVAGKIWMVLNGCDPHNDSDARAIPTLKEIAWPFSIL